MIIAGVVLPLKQSNEADLMWTQEDTGVNTTGGAGPEREKTD